MEKREIEFEIIPIFDQFSSECWHDFARIEMQCDKDKYGYNVDDGDHERIFGDHVKNWNARKHNLAFGAYCDGKMIGFASGYLQDTSNFYLRNLYVKPELNGFGIGSKLLFQTEIAARVFAKSLSLVSLAGAESFYLQKGYKPICDQHMVKELHCHGSGVVPVFHWVKSNIHMDLHASVDSRILRANPNQPIYAYVTNGWTPEINAVGVRTKDGENKIWTDTRANSTMTNYYQRAIISALSKTK